MTRLILPIMLAGLILAGCNKNIQNQEAVRKAVIAYLSKRADLNLNAMTVEVTSLNFRENEADASVSIRLKGGTADQGMQMRYTLERKGNEWVVKERKDQGQNPHGATEAPAKQQEGDLPPGHPPLGK